jgi:hypothetical protein
MRYDTNLIECLRIPQKKYHTHYCKQFITIQQFEIETQHMVFNGDLIFKIIFSYIPKLVNTGAVCIHCFGTDILRVRGGSGPSKRQTTIVPLRLGDNVALPQSNIVSCLYCSL